MNIVFRGFWTLAIAEAYRLDRKRMVRALAGWSATLATCAMLVEARALQAQSLDSVAAFARVIGGPADAPRRSALLFANALFARQGARMAIPHQGIFTDKSAALALLNEAETCAAAFG